MNYALFKPPFRYNRENSTIVDAQGYVFFLLKPVRPIFPVHLEACHRIVELMNKDAKKNTLKKKGKENI